jgi:hypothetical protein
MKNQVEITYRTTEAGDVISIYKTKGGMVMHHSETDEVTVVFGEDGLCNMSGKGADEKIQNGLSFLAE